MRTVALISGGKDSCYNMMQCVAAGHSIVALANLQPIQRDELDSYMYQTVGHQGIDLYAEAMGLPLYREAITGVAVDQGRNYQPTDNDEVEDLFRLLSRIKEEIEIEAVAVGAILSDYQRIRVENVCRRLGLVSLAYLWRRNQKDLLQEMITSGVEAIIIKNPGDIQTKINEVKEKALHSKQSVQPYLIKCGYVNVVAGDDGMKWHAEIRLKDVTVHLARNSVAALGLDPHIHLGMSIRDIQPHLLLMQEKYGLNVCGEGGEYETFTLDCPLFRKRLVIDEKTTVIHTDDPVAPVGYLNLKLHLEQKEEVTIPHIKSSLDFVGDLSDTVFSDLSDFELSESEIESIEKIEKEEKKKQKELHPLLTYSGDRPDDAEESDKRDDTQHVHAYDYDKPPEGYTHIVEDHRSIYGNKHGWYFIGGITGAGADTAIATEDAMKKLINLMSSEGLRLQDICSVNLYMRDMAEYSALNAIYLNHFSFQNPPTRVCVQCPLPNNVGLILDAVAHKMVPNNDTEPPKERVTMHVQGISHWAPANIGPYSQAVKVGEVIGTCGQIALVPGSMTLVSGSARRQCALALRHLTRVLRAAHPRAHVRSVVQSVCYMTNGNSITEARRQLERRTAGAIVQYAVVCALPREAQLEWHAWAHTDNCRFSYEETGCNVGDYKVAITRRWNYENTVAAFVCYVATGSSPSTCQLSFPSSEASVSHKKLASDMSQEHVEQVLQYALNKLIDDYGDTAPALKMRIFYQVSSSPSAHTLVSAVESVRARSGVRAAVTCVPVLGLHNAFTFLSISGLRLDE